MLHVNLEDCPEAIDAGSAVSVNGAAGGCVEGGELETLTLTLLEVDPPAPEQFSV